MPQRPFRVFIPHDHVLEDVLDEVAVDLARGGVEVLRGPVSHPGQKTAFDPVDWPRLFGATDVAMFTSRCLAPGELLRAAPRLRGIVNAAIGLETVDLDTASALGIIVGHGAVPENFLGMAEAAVMLMLNLRLQLRKSEEVLQGTRPRPAARPQEQHARMVRGCTVGLVGYGRIASAVADRLRPFGVRLLAHSPTTRPERFAPDVEVVDLDALLERSDIVGLFAESNARTRGIIDAQALARMKPTAYLVNVARGDLVDEPALERALRGGRIAGAALDVFAEEPLPAGSPLRTLDNVILTPHLVGHTRELYAALAPAALDNIARILRGELPLHCKNPAAEGRWRARMYALDA
ncbi:MAG: NAD(P)-dependent oxidoreductase [Ramlibacter sp.]